MKVRTKYVTVGIVVLLALIVLASWSWVITGFAVNEGGKVLKIGAILPLSGPAAVFGESLFEGMELAREELAAEGIVVDVVYEDSQALSGPGLSAYEKLTSVDDVDLVFSAFSRVSIPLIPLADGDEIPLVMTLVSTTDVARESLYAFRFFSEAEHYVDPFFDKIITKNRYESIAILHLNDEYGVSVRDAIRDRAAGNGILIIAEEEFEPGNADFNTQYIKIEAASADAILFVGGSPPEIINAVKQFRSLGIDADFFEASLILSSNAIRGALGEAAEDIYTNAFPYSVYEENGQEFREDYEAKFGKSPLFTAPIGYDMLKFVGYATKGEAMDGDDIVISLHGLESFDSINGIVRVSAEGEINPEVVGVRIVNGGLVAM